MTACIVVPATAATTSRQLCIPKGFWGKEVMIPAVQYTFRGDGPSATETSYPPPTRDVAYSSGIFIRMALLWGQKQLTVSWRLGTAMSVNNASRRMLWLSGEQCCFTCGISRFQTSVRRTSSLTEASMTFLKPSRPKQKLWQHFFLPHLKIRYRIFWAHDRVVK
jgi:hypothetical protein